MDARGVLVLAALGAAAALALASPTPALAATSAEQVYERGTNTIPSPLPAIPNEPVKEPVVAGEEEQPTTPTIPVGEPAPGGSPGAEDQPEAALGGTLPVTGFDVLLVIGAAAAAGGAGFALRRTAR
jgi:hypothetical protein